MDALRGLWKGRLSNSLKSYSDSSLPCRKEYGLLSSSSARENTLLNYLAKTKNEISRSVKIVATLHF